MLLVRRKSRVCWSQLSRNQASVTPQTCLRQSPEQFGAILVLGISNNTTFVLQSLLFKCDLHPLSLAVSLKYGTVRFQEQKAALVFVCYSRICIYCIILPHLELKNIYIIDYYNMWRRPSATYKLIVWYKLICIYIYIFFFSTQILTVRYTFYVFSKCRGCCVSIFDLVYICIFRS